MSVLIKDLKIPRVGVLSCVVAVADNRILISDINGNTLFEGEYIEVPTPHGRLIDADDLDSITVISYPSKGDPFVAGRLKKIIAPTIIEAEE